MFFYYEPDDTNYEIMPVEEFTGWVESLALTSSDAAGSDFFGYDIKLSSDGTRMVVGAYGEDPSGVSSAGSAYVFEKSGDNWGQIVKLVGSNSHATSWLGYSVDITADGGTVVAGVPYATVGSLTRAGKVVIFEESGSSWIETELTSSDYAKDDLFGESVAISGDGTILVVGAKWEDPVLNNAGSIYVFEKSGGTWSQVAKLWDTDLNLANSNAGTSVAISDDGSTIITGAPAGGYNGPAGRVVIFKKVSGTWQLFQSIAYEDDQQAQGEMFGFSVDANSNGNFLLVGAKWKQRGYLYELVDGSYELSAIFDPSDDAANNGIVSVALNDSATAAILTSNLHTHDVSSAGAAWVFVKSQGTWSETQHITASVRNSGDQFGISVTMDQTGQQIALGALNGDQGATNAGSVYLFTSNVEPGLNAAAQEPTGTGVITSNLQIYLDPESLSGSSDTVWSDYLSGSGTSTLYGNASYVDGSLYLDGADDWVDISGSSAYNFGLNDFTIEMWVKPTTSQIANARIFQMDGPTGNSTANIQMLIVSGKISVFSNGSIFSVAPTQVIADDSWHHIVLSRQDQVAKLYVDNTLAASNANSTNINLNGGSPRPRISGYQTATAYEYKGGLGTFRIYAKALSPSEIEQNYNAEVARFS